MDTFTLLPLPGAGQAGIYLHIPFCKQACHYCSFHFATSLRYKEALTRALHEELTLQKDYLQGRSIRTIYFGGGTPSLLEVEEVASLLRHIEALFPCQQVEEVTLEANPEDLSPEKLAGLRAAGVTRLSIGIQSLNDGVLRQMNRAHHAAQALEVLRRLPEVGFDSYSVDLIYALPQRAPAGWQADLQQLLSFQPPHLSAYNLAVEPGTVWGRQKAAGSFREMEEEEAIAEYELLTASMEAAGYLHYEVSNFCLPGHHSRHNAAYWLGVPYLGVGPAAHSWDGKSRQHNIRHNQLYIAAISRGEIPCQMEQLSVRQQTHEYILLRLRTSWGCSLATLQEVYGYDLALEKTALLAAWQERGWLIHSGDRILLTRQGRLLADELARQLFP